MYSAVTPMLSSTICRTTASNTATLSVYACIDLLQQGD
jgi:hypothetical protein